MKPSFASALRRYSHPAMDQLRVYLPQDRRAALARGQRLPELTCGAALFADISGFTPLSESLDRALGPRRGAEALTRQLNQIYDALIAEVERYSGSVIGFAGDSITCWLAQNDERGTMNDDESTSDTLSSFIAYPSSFRAVACALAMQVAMQPFAAISLPDGTATALALKIAIASGPAHRFVVGNSAIQLLDALAGATVSRMAAGEHLAQPGDTLVDALTAAALGEQILIAEWRIGDAPDQRFTVVAGLQIEDITSRIDPIDNQSAISNLQSEIVRPWLLPAVYERHQAGLGDFLTELRSVVALFLRFGGIDYDTDLDAGSKLDTFLRRVQQIVARYEGALLQLTIGDKGSYLYAAFGAPIAHEDDARRAAHAALACLALPDELDFLQPLQIGISRGVMATGACGSSTRRAYAAMGDEVNLAARLMGRAAPGEILISGRVQTALAAAFELEPLVPIALKGMPEPLPIFRLAGPALRTIRVTEPSYSLPMVGRTAELALIGEKLGLALQGHGQVLGITAEAGMGKSRLLAEVIRSARRRRLRALGGACQSSGTNTPYLVWESIWRAFFDLDPEWPLRKQIRMLHAIVEDLAPDRIDALPLLGPLLGFPLPENDFTQTLEPRSRESALHALLLDCLQAAARQAAADGTGLLIVLEDLHWIDALSHDLLEQIARATRELPVLIVAAYRPPELLRLQTPRSETLEHFTQISLAPITPTEAEQIIRAKLAQLLPERKGAATPALISRITKRAQGNPFYVEELLNYLRDRGIDPRDTAAIETLDLPSSLHTLILSRIDQLSKRERAALKVASVIGRLFRFAHLHGAYPVLGDALVLRTDLDALARLDLTPVDTPEPELTYLFKHIVTQEVAYESLIAQARANLHEQLAAYLEYVAGDDTDQSIDLLAYHYDHSNNHDKRRYYLRRAGEAAAARFANDAAVDYLGRALELLSDDDLAARYDLLLARERVYEVQGMPDGQVADLAALEHLAEALDDGARRAAVAVRRADYALRKNDYSGAGAAAECAVTLAEAAGTPAVAVKAYSLWALALAALAQSAAARARAEASLDLARAIGDQVSAASALYALANVSWTEGDYLAARDYYEQTLSIFRETGDRRGEGRVLGDLGFIAYHGLNDYATARACFEESLRIFRAISDRRSEGWRIASLGHVAQDEGNYSLALTYTEQSLQILRPIDSQAGEHHRYCRICSPAHLRAPTSRCASS